jgi:hypothetical protein
MFVHSSLFGARVFAAVPMPLSSCAKLPRSGQDPALAACPKHIWASLATSIGLEGPTAPIFFSNFYFLFNDLFFVQMPLLDQNHQFNL